MNLESNPRYQRAVQILQRYNPRQKAIFSSMLADEAFAASEAGKRLQLIKMGTENKLGKGRLDIAAQRLGLAKSRQALDTEKAWYRQNLASKEVNQAQDDFDTQNLYNNISDLLGVGNVGMKYYFGSKDIDNKRRIAEMINRDRKNLYPGAYMSGI